MKYIVGIIETEWCTKEDEILPPEIRPFYSSIRVQKVKSDNIETRYACYSVDYSEEDPDNKTITVYLRTLKVFDSKETAENYKNKLVEKIQIFEKQKKYAAIIQLIQEIIKNGFTPPPSDIPSYDREDEERWEREVIRDWEQAIRDCKDM